MSTSTTVGPPSVDIEQLFLFIYELITGGFPHDFTSVWENWKVTSTVLSLLFLTGIVYSIIRMAQIRAEERRIHLEKARKALGTEEEEKKNGRWERVLLHIDSENQNDWKVAVMEADIMLDDLLTERGYVGDTLADKLKQIDKGQMRTLDLAWEAHKMRNRIAHDGAAYSLTQRDARRAIENFRQVFEEANYI